MNTSRKGKPNKVHSEYGMLDYYKHYKKKIKNLNIQYDVSESIYRAIVSDYNKKIASLITDDIIDYKMPHHIGVVGVRKYKPKFSINENGTVINKLPVNPIETAKLWDKDAKAKENKTFVRYTNKHSNGYVFSIHFFKGKAKFKNKMLYTIKPKRSLKRTIAKNAKENLIDAFLLNDK
jgi:hypothetical protein